METTSVAVFDGKYAVKRAMPNVKVQMKSKAENNNPPQPPFNKGGKGRIFIAYSKAQVSQTGMEK
jgi:hypothetical protein